MSQIGSKPPSEAIYYEKRSGCGNDIMCVRETGGDLCAFIYERVTGFVAGGVFVIIMYNELELRKGG
jgi:hypothetical protein